MADHPTPPAAPDSSPRQPAAGNPASKSPGKPLTKDQKEDADDIRRAVDDGMQDLRIKKPG
jgi:hypothetical protein